MGSRHLAHSVAAALAIAMFVSIASVTAHAADAWTVFLRRVGPLRIGASISEVRRALDDATASLTWNGVTADDSTCAYLRSSQLPDGLGLMFQKGRFVRADITTPGITTASGVGIGDTEATIERVYPGHITIGPHKYDFASGAHYVTYRARDVHDHGFGIVFETSGQRIARFRVGTVEAVSLVEGCA